MLERSGNNAGLVARETLIQAGLELFGLHGYNMVSVRQICEKADMNVASINYHFGGKEGLYIAVADHISAKLNEHMWPVAEPVFSFLESNSRDVEQATEHVQNILEAMADILIPESVEAEKWARFITRFQLGDDVPEHNLSKHELSGLMTRLIGIIRGAENESRINAIYLQTLIGQALVFRVSRASSKHALGIDKIGQAESDQIKQILRSNVRSIFSEYLDNE